MSSSISWSNYHTKFLPVSFVIGFCLFYCPRKHIFKSYLHIKIGFNCKLFNSNTQFSCSIQIFHTFFALEMKSEVTQSKSLEIALTQTFQLKVNFIFYVFIPISYYEKKAFSIILLPSAIILSVIGWVGRG